MHVGRGDELMGRRSRGGGGAASLPPCARPSRSAAGPAWGPGQQPGLVQGGGLSAVTELTWRIYP